MAADLGTLLDSGYLGDLAERSMEDVRAMRADCQEVESAMSLLRRLVQGRLDIVGLELRRRATGAVTDEATDLIAQLPEVLADRTHAPGVGRLPQIMAPGDLPEGLQGELDAIVGPGELVDLKVVDDERLRSIAGELDAFERRVSDQRRALFDRIDALQAEVIRRYKSGEASIDSLLK